ncbi:MAG: DUF5671 domain-containing protein [Dehalococcoidia bacterium]|nr:DUF5671 domain-containing protein [Dehalococcoidia bacterium]MDW8120388.1 DUF5671 domain-containing protein [Chloroflexota bacterium]
MSNARRLYFYSVAFIALMVSASGATSLLGMLLQLALGDILVAPGRATREQASVALAMLVVSVPLWAVHWGIIQRSVRRTPDEAGAVVRKLALYGALGLAAAILFSQTVTVLVRAFRGDGDAVLLLPAYLVWGAVWFYHWGVERAEGQPSAGARTIRRWYIYLTSSYGLGALVGGSIFALAALLTRAYDALLAMPYLARPGPLWDAGMHRAVALVLAGGAWWAFHGLGMAKHDTPSLLRRVYLSLWALLGGAVPAVGVTAFVLSLVLAWVLGASPAGTIEHFRSIPRVLPALGIALALLAYHGGVMQRELEQAGQGESARRVLGYGLSALGLATLMGGMVALWSLLLGLATLGGPAPLVGPDPGRGLLAVALALLAVGGPLWASQWTRLHRRAHTAGAPERSALARRIFLYGVLGVLAVLALTNAVAFLSLLLRDILAGRVAWGFLEAGRWPLGILLTTLPLLAYHWQVLREDQRAEAQRPLVRKTITLVVGEKGRPLHTALEQALGTRLEVLWVVETEGEEPPTLTPEALDALVERIRTTPAPRVLVLALGGTIRIYPRP